MQQHTTPRAAYSLFASIQTDDHPRCALCSDGIRLWDVLYNLGFSGSRLNSLSLLHAARLCPQADDRVEWTWPCRSVHVSTAPSDRRLPGRDVSVSIWPAGRPCATFFIRWSTWLEKWKRGVGTQPLVLGLGCVRRETVRCGNEQLRHIGHRGRTGGSAGHERWRCWQRKGVKTRPGRTKRPASAAAARQCAPRGAPVLRAPEPTPCALLLASCGRPARRPRGALPGFVP